MSEQLQLPVSDFTRAKQFYGETLGLGVDMDAEGGVTYTSGGAKFFVSKGRYKASGGTQMSWFVRDINVRGWRAEGRT